MESISEHRIGEIRFFVLPRPFQPFRLVLWLSDLVLDFWMIAISRNTLQQFARDNCRILHTLKFCLFEASWIFTTCL